MLTDVQVLVRRAEPRDVFEIQELLYQAWLVTYPNAEYGVTRRDVVEFFSNRLEPGVLARRTKMLAEADPARHVFLVVERESRVVGVCFAYRLSGEPNEVAVFYVHPRHFRRGIGTTLWQKTLERLDPNQTTVLNVAKYNARAIAFYRSIGFVTIGCELSDIRFRMASGAVIPEIRMRRPAEA